MNLLIPRIALACLFVFTSLACTSQATTDRPPNVVIFYTDDMGYADLSSYDSKICTTPNLDKLAASGMRFTSFYVSEAVCSASRSSLITGCYAQRISIRGALGPGSKHGLHPEETTIAELVKPLGYATAAFGKWHLGHTPHALPDQHGFDEYFGLPYSNDMWPWHYGDQDRGLIGNPNWPDLPVIDGTKTVETNPRQESLTPRYTKRALDFIDRKQDGPFLLYFAYSHPHVPIAASDKFKGSTGKGLYADMIAEIDDSAGQVVNKLEELGLRDNTLVVFASDNGPWTRFGNEAGETGPLRGDKGTAFEGGVRVPGIFSMPGTIPARQESAALASTMDILPTIAALTGAELPSRKIDGHNILPLLKGKTDKSPHEAFYYYYGGELHAVRVGDWKLHTRHKWRKVVSKGKDGHPGKQAYPVIEQSLFNLKDDIGETTNVADQHPEVVEQLLKVVEQARSELGDRLTKRQGSEVRPNSGPAKP
ncbi:MAG: sulfatase family protein [Phycisphaeraceae bacterium]